MHIRRACADSLLECTKLCLVPRIIQHIEEEGYLPCLLSPCKHTPGAPYWLWMNRYHGDLVSIDLDGREDSHIRTIRTGMEVSIFFK